MTGKLFDKTGDPLFDDALTCISSRAQRIRHKINGHSVAPTEDYFQELGDILLVVARSHPEARSLLPQLLYASDFMAVLNYMGYRAGRGGGGKPNVPKKPLPSTTA